MNNTIKISMDKNGDLKITFNYDPDIIKKIKTIKGYRWNQKEKYWSYPYSEQIIKKII